MKFITAYNKKGGKYLLKIELEDGNVKWMTTTKAVYEYASNNFKEGDEVGITYTEKNSQYHVTRINQDGKSSVAKADSEEETETKEEKVFKCEDCGKELKSDKYKKCYECNKKNPEKRSKSTSDSIEKQCAYKVAAMALQIFTGQIEDLEVLKNQLDNLATHVLNKFQGD